jgi:hypothetical protein
MMRSVDSQRFAIRETGGGLRSPRIAVIIDKFVAARGGAAVYTRDLLLWLAARGFDVHVVTREVGVQERSLPFTYHGVHATQATFYDACSLATLESLASGLPVITTRANGASELITPGIDGIVLDDPGDATALAGALRTLAGDRLLRASMGRAARRLATRNGIDAAFARIAGVYAEVLEAKGQRLVDLAASGGRVFPGRPGRQAPAGDLPKRRHTNHTRSGSTRNIPQSTSGRRLPTP